MRPRKIDPNCKETVIFVAYGSFFKKKKLKSFKNCTKKIFQEKYLESDRSANMFIRSSKAIEKYNNVFKLLNLFEVFPKN